MGSGVVRQQSLGRARIPVSGSRARGARTRRLPDEHATYLRRIAALQFLSVWVNPAAHAVIPRVAAESRRHHTRADEIHMKLFITKPFLPTAHVDDTAKLKRVLTARQLVLLGI